jgi:hypothetical protein
LLLGQVSLLAKLLDASSQLLSCIHPTPCVMGVISHRQLQINRTHRIAIDCRNRQ